jgi:hypothetical protein
MVCSQLDANDNNDTAVLDRTEPIWLLGHCFEVRCLTKVVVVVVVFALANVAEAGSCLTSRSQNAASDVQRSTRHRSSSA